MALAIGLQATSACDMQCDHCYLDRAGRSMDLSVVEKTVEYARLLGGAFLSLTGGEPTLHPEFPRLVRMLGESGQRFGMVSNGWSFAERYPALRPYRKAIGRQEFSLDGAGPESHDAARREGSFDRILQAAGVCSADGVAIGFRTTVTRANLDELEQIALLAGKLGAEVLTLVPLMPTPQMAALGRLLEPEDMYRLAEDARRLRGDFRMRVELAAGTQSPELVAPCPALAMRSLFVDADGLVRFCCQLAGHAVAPGSDRPLADLGETGWPEAHSRAMGAVEAFRAAKLRRLERGELGAMDSFPCWYCMKHFGLAGWMADLPGGAWAADLRGDGRPADGAQPDAAFYRQAPNVRLTRLGDDRAALVSADRCLPCALSGTGPVVWDLLADGADVGRIAESLADEFDVDPEQAQRDAHAFLQEMLALGLVVRTQRPGSPKGGEPHAQPGA